MSNVVVGMAVKAANDSMSVLRQEPDSIDALDVGEPFKMPSTLLNISSDTDNGQDAGGLSGVDSFHDDPQAEILRLRALLRQRDDTIRQRDEEITDKNKLLGHREGLLRQSKQIIDRLVQDNDTLKLAAADASRAPPPSVENSAQVYTRRVPCFAIGCNRRFRRVQSESLA